MALASVLGQGWLVYVAQDFLPSLQCPQEVAQEYARQVQGVDKSKQLRKVFVDLFGLDKR